MQGTAGRSARQGWTRNEGTFGVVLLLMKSTRLCLRVLS